MSRMRHELCCVQRQGARCPHCSRARGARRERFRPGSLTHAKSLLRGAAWHASPTFTNASVLAAGSTPPPPPLFTPRDPLKRVFLQRVDSDLWPVSTRQLLQWYDDATAAQRQERATGFLQNNPSGGYVEPGLGGGSPIVRTASDFLASKRILA